MVPQTLRTIRAHRPGHRRCAHTGTGSAGTVRIPYARG